MPYSGADDKNLPDNVKKLPAKVRRQWVAVWNQSYEACQDEGGEDCESVAFQKANGVIKRGDMSIADNFLFADLATLGLLDGKSFDALAPGKFIDMYGRDLEIKESELETYVANTKRALESTRTESGEMVGLPIDAQDHDKGDGAGWIVDVRLEDGKVRVVPKWTEIGIDLIGKGIRRFFSATVDTARKVIMGGTLTNWPASRHHKTGEILLRPVELSDIGLIAIEESDPTLFDKFLDRFMSMFYDLAEFDDSEWDAGAVRSSLSISDLRKVCLLDLNGYSGQDEPTKGLCLLPYKKTPGSSPNRNAVKAMASGHGISAVKKPADVPNEYFMSKRRSAAKRAASLWRSAFDKDVPESISRYLTMQSIEKPDSEDNIMALELTQEELEGTISKIVDNTVGTAVTAAIEKALGANPVQPKNGDDGDEPAKEISAAELMNMLNLGPLEEEAVKRIEDALASQAQAVSSMAEQRYMQKLAQITRKRDVGEFATRIVGGTSDAPHALAGLVTAEDLQKHLLALPKEEAKFWQDLLGSIAEHGLTVFEEVGHNTDVKGQKQLPEYFVQKLKAGELKVEDLGDPILALGDVSEYDLSEFKK